MKDNLLLVANGDGSLYPATERDFELVKRFKRGDAVKAKLSSQSRRSYQHHKLYFGGLVKLAMQYWNPTGGFISAAEKQTLKGLISFVERQGHDSEAVTALCKAFLNDLRQTRAMVIEAPHRDAQALHEWIKEEAGYYDWVKTPEGLVKRTHSISFGKMNQDDFNLFYKRAFSVVWCFLLSRSFKSESEAQEVINQIVGMG